MNEISLFWFRRDLRLFDNRALQEAVNSGLPVLCVFIFDDLILSKLPKNDARVTFIHQTISHIHKKLNEYGSSLIVKYGSPVQMHKKLSEEFTISKVYFNEDYEPYATERDRAIIEFYNTKNIEVNSYKDQVIHQPGEVVKGDGKPYTVFTPYKNKWLNVFDRNQLKEHKVALDKDVFVQISSTIPDLISLGFEESVIHVKPYNIDAVNNYDSNRDFPSKKGTSYLGPHLRFGTVSIREITKIALENNDTFLSELIWREFFMQTLYYFPQVINHSFRKKYDLIKWENNESQFKAWCEGKTGYPMVDAGMRELNQTGYMHNRVRMVVASFLCKHLLIDWRWGEAYFAEKLLDYDLASNNGNWQWAAGTGCDAAPYFRVFNPTSQQQKFDREGNYIKKWVPELNSFDYPQPIVEHKWARERAIERYKEAIN